MGYSIGYDNNWKRDIGYGVPAPCDLPKCDKIIDRGLSYVCGSDPYGGDYGCGLFFCEDHMHYRSPRGHGGTVMLCPRCYRYRPPYNAKPDCKKWIDFKMKDPSWKQWRKENKT